MVFGYYVIMIINYLVRDKTLLVVLVVGQKVCFNEDVGIFIFKIVLEFYQVVLRYLGERLFK